ncbi:MAG: hypothetical protein HY763_06615 [Planctomycetes bacterium]|nr:hypothetical protein [Planctomycetota bacterium]
MSWGRHNQSGFMRVDARSHRRPGSILVMVMAVLGLLFLVGVAFMTTMRFEAGMITADKNRVATRPGVVKMMEGLEDVMRTTMMQATDVPTTGELFGSAPMTFAELPGVHNFFAPIEPVADANGDYVFPWATDILALTQADPDNAAQMDFRGSALKLTWPPDGKYMPPVNTRWRPGLRPQKWAQPPAGTAAELVTYTPLDADGDGISDSFAVPLSKMPGVDRKQMVELSRVLNPATKPDGEVFLGLRVIAHGAMVDLGASHPLLIRNVTGPNVTIAPPYSALVEEGSLRRRNLLAPYELPPTLIQGNPLGKDPDLGGGHFAAELFPPNESLRLHRYWPFKPDEPGPDPDVPLWASRMDPAYLSDLPSQDHYDRRHLVTSVSYDHQLRRMTYYPRPGDPNYSTGPDAHVDEVLEAMVAANTQPDVAKTCLWDPAAPPPLLPFEYANYPYGSENTITVKGSQAPPYGSQDWCSCAADPGRCEINPLKGRLRLSLPWLDGIAGVHKDRVIRLIQDVFTIMLLNARHGTQDPVDNTFTWQNPTLHDISLTAASLTANLIDFADADQTPTMVELRSADLGTPGKAGRPLDTPEFVFGIERQPFITEVVAVVKENPPGTLDLTQSFFGVELYNPFPAEVSLGYNEYELRATYGGSAVTVALPTMKLAPRAFVGFYDGEKSVPTPQVQGGTTVAGLKFDKNATIQLVRLVGGKAVVLDEVSLSGSSVGELNAGLWSVEKPVKQDSTSVWFAPLPMADVTSIQQSSHTFGGPATRSDPQYVGYLPVQVVTADKGTFADSFPTTGTLLLLMRHANSERKPFTSYLTDKETKTGNDYFAIDNGRMPVFDPTGVHHVDPKYDPLNTTGESRAGDVMHLPWGQLVFDYFTALPPASVGPYKTGPNGPTIDLNAGPKVDLDGLRVQGRININAAPWKVLEGLPFVALSRIPGADVQSVFSLIPAFDAAVTNPSTPTPIGPALAKAIVAYRELRELNHREPGEQPAYSGNYDDGSLNGGARNDAAGARGWAAASPQFRRGGGFLTVGELANVRFAGARGTMRIDSLNVGQGQAGGENYLSAIAVLVALGDWVTVRSDVFTVYGVLRGEEDESIVNDVDAKQEIDMRLRDVDSRALRFQETVNRLPLLRGERAPERLGDRVLGKYTDCRGN